ncbi:MAG: TIM barrel protein [Novosphingobium sp.]|nr:TIM barrel protein [Novosphingobium sp.]
MSLPPFCLNGFNGSPYLGQEEDLPGWIDAAAAAGFPLFGPDTFSLAAWEERGNSLTGLARHFRDAGMGCGYIAAAGMFDGGPHALPALLKAAEAGEALGAPFLQINMGGPDKATRRAALEQACEAIDGRGFKLAIEYMPYVGLSSVAETVALARHVGTERAGAMIDIWHHSRGTDTWDDLAAIPLDAIAYVEMDDAFPAESDNQSAETLTRRTFCGEGEFDVARFTGLLRDKGYDGMVSVEVLNREWQGRPRDEFARNCFDSTARFWQ